MVTLTVSSLGFIYESKTVDKASIYRGDLWDKTGYEQNVATDLGATVESVCQANSDALRREMTLDEVTRILDTTIKRDRTTKLACFLAYLCTYTDSSQINIGFVASSSTGKSYIALQVADYFPSGDVLTNGYTSPTAFFHDHRNSTFDAKRKVWTKDLSQKILIFLDQMHYGLQEKLRPILSHDKKEITSQIVNKTQKAGNETETTVLRGYATFVFCTNTATRDEQEATRLLLLSPETTQKKLSESIDLAAFRYSDSKSFETEVLGDARRRWLRQRVLDVKNAAISDVVIPAYDESSRSFKGKHAKLAPRNQRDIFRLLTFVKGHALLNFQNRQRLPDGRIIAAKKDVEAGFNFYLTKLSTSNELGIAPEVYEVWKDVVEPLWEAEKWVDVRDPKDSTLKKLVRNREYGITQLEIQQKYFNHYGYILGDEKLRKMMLPSWTAAGLVRLTKDPSDRRGWVLLPPAQTQPPLEDKKDQP